MKKIVILMFMLLCCKLLAQSPSDSIQKIFKAAYGEKNPILYYRNLYSYLSKIPQEAYRTIFEIQKKYYNIDKQNALQILRGVHYLYNLSSDDSLRTEIIYLYEQSINDSSIHYTDRDNISQILISGIDLNLFDKKLKAEIMRNINYPYNGKTKQNMLNRNMLLLAGALNLNESTDRLHVIIDSCNNTTYVKAAKIALCRMGDPKIKKEYFDEINSMSLKDIINDHYEEIEFIKQPECISILIKILNSNETEPAVKENMPAEKIAYFAMKTIAHIAFGCTIKVDGIYSNQRDSVLEQVRIWVKNHSIHINRNIW